MVPTKDNHGTTMPGAAKQIENPIYSELLAIGSTDKSMRADALAKSA